MPLDLPRTLRPVGGIFAEDGWWRAARTPEGPGTLHLRRSPAGVLARSWGDGAEWMLARLTDWLGLGDSPEALVTDHRLVGRLVRRHAGVRFAATGLVFEALLTAIVTQKVTGKEARRSLTALRRRYSDAAPGPRPLRLPPCPYRLAEAPYWELHRLGLERRRSDILTTVARDHERIEQLADFPSPVVQSRLRRYRGVGVWTAAETVAVSHGDADAVSVGDYHHKNLVAWHLAGVPRGTDAEMLALLEPFRPHRGRVVRLLEMEGRAPAFGPRMPLRSFTDL